MLVFVGYATVVLVTVCIGYLGYSYFQLRANLDGLASVPVVAARLVDGQRIPSISFAVIRNGDVGPVATIGSEDVTADRAATVSTLYEAASLTKPVIAELARRLYQQGRFKLDEQVARSVTSARITDSEVFERVTPRQLLAHTSGLPNWSGDSNDLQRTDPLGFDFEPGTAFQYSGEGYGLLLRFLEVKSGQSAEALSAGLFAELGMDNSTLVASEYPGSYARGHWGTAAGREAARTAEAIAAFSLFTNAADYSKFLAYVMRRHGAADEVDDPFSKTQVAFKADSANQLGWSLGWGTLTQSDRTVSCQWGDNGAFRSFSAFDPATQNGVVYFVNGSYGTAYAEALARPVLGDISFATSWFSHWYQEVARAVLRI